MTYEHLWRIEQRNLCSNLTGRCIYRRTGKGFLDPCVIEIAFERWEEPSVMVWAGLTHHHKMQILLLDFGRGLTAQRCIGQILLPIVLPSIAAHQVTLLQ